MNETKNKQNETNTEEKGEEERFLLLVWYN